jgi:lipopolysaccharide export system protein LptC
MTRRSNVTEAVVQTIGSATARARRDWTARTRDTAFHALRYSRFVGVMKRALPTAAGALIAIVLIFALLPRQTYKVSFAYERMGRIDNDLAMLKPRLTGSDQSGNPFVITADAAIQQGANARKVLLKKVEADLTFDKNRWMNASAMQGFVDMEKSALSLTGGIAVFSDDGYELHTERANVDLKKGIFHGPGEVTGQGPMGTLRADTFELDRTTKQITLHGHVQMTIIASQAHKP